MTKGWSDEEVNTKFDDDLNPYATRPNFHREYMPSRFQIQHILQKYPGENKGQTYFYIIMPKMAKKLPYNLHERAFYKIVKFVLTKKGYQ